MSDRPSEQDWYRENGRTSERSAGQLMKEITEDLSTLIRKEIELAKQELGSAVTAKATGAVIFAVVGVMGFFMLIFLLLALRDGLDTFMWTWVSDLVTVGVLGLVALVAALVAKRKLATPINADMTKKTIKEDVEWAKTLGKQ